MKKRPTAYVALCILGGALTMAAQDAPAPASQVQPLKVPRANMDRQRITSPLPIYPEDAKSAAIGGVVGLKILVAPSSSVQHAEVISGPEKLRSAAVEAVARWTFQPYLLNGRAATIETTEAFNFSAADGVVTMSNATEGPVRISAGMMAGRIVTKVTPSYPEDAKKARITGAVVMHATISKEGDIANIEVISGPDMLRDAALDAVRQWKYKPYLLNGEPVAVNTQITVNFALGNPPVKEPGEIQ